MQLGTFQKAEELDVIGPGVVNKDGFRVVQVTAMSSRPTFRSRFLGGHLPFWTLIFRANCLAPRCADVDKAEGCKEVW